MRIAVVNETSAADRNADILAALANRGYEVLNVGMTRSGAQPELQYTHTGFISALLLNLKRVDYVVGGCGTGQGYLNSVLQYPGVVCGLILDPVDAWLFAQINGGNCISLALNKGYGWAGDVNLRFIFDRLFSVERGSGYPPHRREAQRASIRTLEAISQATHRSLAEIVAALPDNVFWPAVEYPGVLDIIDLPSITDLTLKEALLRRLGERGMVRG